MEIVSAYCAHGSHVRPRPEVSLGQPAPVPGASPAPPAAVPPGTAPARATGAARAPAAPALGRTGDDHPVGGGARLRRYRARGGHQPGRGHRPGGRLQGHEEPAAAGPRHEHPAGRHRRPGQDHRAAAARVPPGRTALPLHRHDDDRAHLGGPGAGHGGEPAARLLRPGARPPRPDHRPAARPAPAEAERGLCRGRPPADRAHGRGHDPGEDRPLPGGRLHQLHADRGRPRRGPDLHGDAAEGHLQRTRPRARHAHPAGRPGAPVRALTAPGRRERPGPDEAPAAVPGGTDREGHLVRGAAEPDAVPGRDPGGAGLGPRRQGLRHRRAARPRPRDAELLALVLGVHHRPHRTDALPGQGRRRDPEVGPGPVRPAVRGAARRQAAHRGAPRRRPRRRARRGGPPADPGPGGERHHDLGAGQADRHRAGGDRLRHHPPAGDGARPVGGHAHHVRPPLGPLRPRPGRGPAGQRAARGAGAGAGADGDGRGRLPGRAGGALRGPGASGPERGAGQRGGVLGRRLSTPPGAQS
ncbi:putative Efflux ABC transporter, permease/ATP-binding protein [Streptomyces misionensis JCM 4497]